MEHSVTVRVAIGMRRGLQFLLMVLFASTGTAGCRFSFVVESTGDPLVRKRAGTILVVGPSYRVDWTEGAFDSSAVFSVDGGESETALNSERSTYFRPKFLLAELPDSRLLAMPPLQSGKVPTVSVREVRLREEPETHLIEGRKTRKYVLNLSYEVKVNVGSERVRGIFTATAELWTTDEIEVPVLPENLQCSCSSSRSADGTDRIQRH